MNKSLPKCDMCGEERPIVYVDRDGKNYCHSCKATYICSGCGKPFRYCDDNFICDDCGVVI